MDEAYFEQVELALYFDSEENQEVVNKMVQQIRNEELELNSVDFLG